MEEIRKNAEIIANKLISIMDKPGDAFSLEIRKKLNNRYAKVRVIGRDGVIKKRLTWFEQE